MAHSRAAAIFTTACAPLIWGSTYLVTTEFLPPDRPLTAALLRVLPAGLLLLMYARVLPRRSEWSTVILLGILNIGFFQAMLFVAAYRLPGGLAAVLSSTQTLMVLLLTWLIGKTMPPKAAWLWAAAGVAGIALMVLSPQARYDAWGIAAALSGAASMSLGVYLSKHRRTSLPVLAFAGWQLLVGGLCLLPAALLAEPPLPALTLANIGGYLYLCLFGAVLAYVLFSEPVQSLAVRGKSADRDGLQGANRRRALWPGEDLQRGRPPESALSAPADRLWTGSQRACPIAACRGVVAGAAQPGMRVRAGLAVSGARHGWQIAAGLCAGAAFD